MPATTDTYLLLRALTDELVRSGVRHAATSPGSRSTPLVLTLAGDDRLRCWSHVDERCAAFFALGVAKASGVPAVLACTSGTAAANFLPAVIEAHEAGVPLIVLTADRPPELRDVGAGQTIDQLKLYGDAVRWFVELGTHEATPERLRWVRQLACRVVGAALGAGGGRPGPVHVNVPLREPLVLDGPLPEDGSGRPDGAPFTRIEPSRGDAVQGGLAVLSAAVERPRAVVVAGRLEPRDAPVAQAAAACAAARGWPLLAEPLSGARGGPAAVAHYDALLRDARFADEHRPDLVVRVGDLPTSKPLRLWLAGLDARQIAFAGPGAWSDPAAVVEWVAGNPVGVLDRAARADVAPAPGWLESWRDADAAAAGALRETLGDDLTEPAVAREVATLLGAGDVLVVAASMPVRDVETFWPALPDPPRVLANRGANGIDGTISTAFGVAAAHGGRVVLLVGDVALAHDIGGLLAAPRLGLDLTVVVVDNGGGGIFDFLPVAGSDPAVYEEHVATPTGLEVERIAALFGCGYDAPADLTSFRDAVAAATGTTLVHVRTERAANVALHRRCWAAVADVLA